MFRADLLQQLGRRGSHHLHDSLQLVNILTGDQLKAVSVRECNVGIESASGCYQIKQQSQISAWMTSFRRTGRRHAGEGYSLFREKALFLSAALP